MNPTVDAALALLDGAENRLAAAPAVVGLDGFVDQILRVVARKGTDGAAQYIPDIPAFAARVAHAAGMSTALELHVQQTKLGGNGPIMANALAALGVPLTYVGAVGGGDGIHPAFAPLARRCRVIPVCAAAATDALEFADGKLMFQQMACLDELDFEAIRGHLGADRLLELFEAAAVVALNHWSSLPHMSAIWRRLQAEICPRLSFGRRELFFDLADPEKREAADIAEALRLIGGFEHWYRTALGLNEKESEHICQVLGCEPTGCRDGRERVQERARRIRARLGIAVVAVHPTRYAAAADADTEAVVDGPFVAEPLISTGAGDHFNCGFCAGRLLGGDLASCLQLGVATSGYYVRTAASPGVAELCDFLASLAAGGPR